MSLEPNVSQSFSDWLGGAPALVARAPGRVNLIGEHTDYNDGFVLPMAIDRAVWLAARQRPDRRVVVRAADFAETASFQLDDLQPAAGWIEYIKGVAWSFREAGHSLRGWEGVIAGNLPVGAGLSSSAALELAAARVFAALSRLEWRPAAMALLCQKAENEWVGVNCGVMDQMIVAAGQAGCALLIDCRSLETTPVPLPAGVTVVILDTATRRGLSESAYNERRAQCEAAARFFDAPSLRDVTPADFQARGGRLEPLIRRRARHVIRENERVLAAAEALREGDAAGLGRLMNASHASLRDDYQVSCRELDLMAAIAQAQPGCYGARMTGAGFGGCAAALVQEEKAADFAAVVTRQYREAAGLTPTLYICRPAGGATIELVSVQT